MSIYSLLDKKATIKRVVDKTSDGMGGFKPAAGEPQTIAADVSAGVQPMSQKERIEYQQQKFPVTHYLFFLPGTDIKPNDTVEVGNYKFTAKTQAENALFKDRYLEVLAEEASR